MTNLDDVAAINRLRYEYAFGIDTRDYQLLRSVFVEDITVDFTSYSGGEIAKLTADDWVARCARLFDGLDATQHSMMSPLVDIDPSGNRGRQRTSMQAAHFLDGVEFTLGGWYEDQLVRTDIGWKIGAVQLTVTWRRGDETIMHRSGRG